MMTRKARLLSAAATIAITAAWSSPVDAQGLMDSSMGAGLGQRSVGIIARLSGARSKP